MAGSGVMQPPDDALHAQYISCAFLWLLVQDYACIVCMFSYMHDSYTYVCESVLFLRTPVEALCGCLDMFSFFLRLFSSGHLVRMCRSVYRPLTCYISIPKYCLTSYGLRLSASVRLSEREFIFCFRAPKV